MAELLINELKKSPTLVAVLLLYGKFDKRCALIEREIVELREEQNKCWFKS